MSDNNNLKYKIEVDASQATKNLQKFQRDLKAAFDGKGIKPGLNAMNKEMTSSLNKMSNDMSKMAKGMSKEIEKSTSGMTTGLKNQLKRMSKLSSVAMNTGKVLGKAVLKGMQMALTGVAAIGKVLFKALSALAGSFLSIGKLFGTAISNGIRMCAGLMRTAGKFLTSAISTGIKMGYGVIKFAARGLVNTISVSLEGAYKVASNVAGKITGVISKAINQEGKINLQANMGNYKSESYRTLSGDVFMNSMNNMLSAMKATLPKQIGSVFESVTMGVANSFNKLANTVLLVSQSFTFFKAFGPKILSMISSLVSSVKPYIQSAMNLVGAYMKLQMGTTFAPLRAAFGLLVNQCKAAGQALVDMGHNTISSLSSVAQIMTTVWQTLSSAVNIVINAFGFLKENIGVAANALKNTFNNIKMPFEEILTPLKVKILEMAATAEGPFKEALLSVAAFMEGDFLNGFKHGITAFTEGIPALLKYIQTSFAESIGFVVEVFKQLPRVIGDTVAALKPWVSAFNTLLGVLKPFVPVVTELYSLVMKLIQVFGLWAKDIVNTLDFFKAPIEKFAKFIETLISKMNNWINNKLGLNNDKKYAGMSKKEVLAGKKQELSEAEAKQSKIYKSPFTMGKAMSTGELSSLQDKIKKLKDEIKELENSADDIELDLDTTAAENDINSVKKELEKILNEEPKQIKFDIDSSAEKEIEKLEKEINEVSNVDIKTIKFDNSAINKAKKDFENAINNTGVSKSPKNMTDDPAVRVSARYDEIVRKIKEIISSQDAFTSSVNKTAESVKKTADNMDEVTMHADDIDVSESASAFDTLRNKAQQAADAIKNRLNNIETNVSQEEVEELTNDFAKAKKEFQEMFKIKGGSGSLKKDLGGIMEQVSKYSTMLAKIKNPLLTVRTEKAKQAFKELTDNAKATKAAYDKFSQSSKIDKGIQASGSGFSMLEKMESKVIKLKDGFNLLKASMKTAFSYGSFNKAAGELGKSEKDLQDSINLIVKMKDKVKAAFKTMFDGAKSTAKSGWAKIASIFKKGTSDCERPVNRLKGIVGKLAGAFGLYQLGSIMKDASQSAIKYEAALATVQRTLGGASQKLIDFADTNAVAWGLSKEQALSYGNIYSLLVSNFESDADKVAGTTEKLLQAAGTIAAGTGDSIQTVLDNIRSAINGSSESVDQYGLALKTANLAAAAGVKNWNDLTVQQQQAIITQQILNQTAAKYGGIVDTAASRQAMFTAQLANTKMALGNLG